MFFTISLIVKGVTYWAVQWPDGHISHNFITAAEAQAYADYLTDAHS